MSVTHYLGPSIEAVGSLPENTTLEAALLSDSEFATSTFNGFGRTGTFYLNDATGEALGYDMPGLAEWTGEQIPNSEWYNSTKFCNDYVTFNKSNPNNTILSNDNSGFMEPNIDAGMSFANYALGIMGPIGMGLGSMLWNYGVNNTNSKAKIASLCSIGAGASLSAVSLSNMFNYSNSYNAAIATGDYMTALSSFKGLSQTSGSLALGSGIGLGIDGAYRLIHGINEKNKLEAIVGAAEIGGGVALGILGSQVLSGASANWVSTSAIGVSAEYTMSVAAPSTFSAVGMMPALGLIGLIATGVMAAVSFIMNRKKKPVISAAALPGLPAAGP